MSRAAKVSLLRWLRRQLREQDPLRERLEAAIDNDDSAKASRIVARYELSAVQRQHLNSLLEEWEQDLQLPGKNLKIRPDG